MPLTDQRNIVVREAGHHFGLNLKHDFCVVLTDRTVEDSANPNFARIPSAQNLPNIRSNRSQKRHLHCEQHAYA